MNMKDRIDSELQGVCVDPQLRGRIIQKARSAKKAPNYKLGFAVAGAALTACAALALLVLPNLMKGATLTPLTGEEGELVLAELTPAPTEEPLPEPEETPQADPWEPYVDDISLNYDRIPENPEIPTRHRPGFREAEIIFVEIKATDEYRDITGKKLGVTNYDVAQYGLREFYDLTGYLVEKCYVEPHDKYDKTGPDAAWFNYSLDGGYYSEEWEGMIDTHFLRYAVSADFRSDVHSNMICIGYTVYTMSGEPYRGIEVNTSAESVQAGYTSLIPMDNIARPANIASMSVEEIAQWYYENSAYGDRRRVARAEFFRDDACWGGGGIHFTEVHLYLENGEYYRVWLESDTHLIVAMFGVYSS